MTAFPPFAFCLPGFGSRSLDHCGRHCCPAVDWARRLEVQVEAVEIGGYCQLDEAPVTAAMRPIGILNGILG